MSDVPEGEWTEAVDANIPRVDLVGRAANGSPGFLLMKQNENAGLLDANFVRSLIAKAEPEPTPQETVTMTGSPAAIAAMIHAAAVRKADSEVIPAAAPADGIEKAKYDADDLKRMAASGAAMDDESYPIADREDLDRAIRAVGRGGADHDDIRRHVMARAKELGASSEIPDNWASDGSLKKGMGSMETDDIELTEVLAEPEIDAPGNPTTPGSPAWEAIDAATACKWTAVLARARAAIDVMAEREMLEAAAGDDSDAESAWDLQDACCAIDYAISVLAPFAVGEHAEAEMGADMLAAVGKAVAAATAPLEVIEGLAPIRKAGRVLSSTNEAAIRGAVESLQKVLASLPAAPAVEDAVTKTANQEPDMPTPTPSEDVTADSGQEPAMGSAPAEPKPVAGQAVTDMAKAETDEATVTKAPKLASMMPVYNKSGDLIGVVDPTEVTQLTGDTDMAAADTRDAGDTDGGMDGDTQMAEVQPTDDGTTPTDLAPAPADAVGTPADATSADDDGNVAKAIEPTDTVPTTMLKSSDVQAMVKAALDDYSAGQADVVKGLEDQNRALEERNQALIEKVAGYEDRLATLENAPAVMAIASNGAIPPQHLLRGQDRDAPALGDLAKAQQMRDAFTASDDAVKQQALAQGLNALAIEELSRIHAAGPR